MPHPECPVGVATLISRRAPNLRMSHCLPPVHYHLVGPVELVVVLGTQHSLAWIDEVHHLQEEERMDF